MTAGDPGTSPTAPESGVGTIGFLGLGDMGAGIAANYARSGLDLMAFDLRPELEPEVIGWGGRWASNAEALVASSDILCLCLVDDRQVLAAVDGGLLAGMNDEALLVVHSTVSPATMRRIAATAAERGCEVVDAPVSGGHAASVKGTLSVMVGAPEFTYRRLKPLWDAMSAHAFRIGDEPGSGQVAKLCNNMMGLTNNLVALEAMGMARAFGVPEAVVRDVAAQSTGGSWYIDHWGFIDDLLLTHPQAGEAADFHLIRKDLESAVEVGTAAGARLAISSRAAEGAQRILAERLALLRERQP